MARGDLLPPTSITAGTIGAMHELVASADLMRRGYHVFRALSPSCPCDILAYRDGQQPIRIEVRTTHRNVDGTIRIPVQPKDDGKYDAYAFVTHQGDILYYPSGIIA